MSDPDVVAELDAELGLIEQLPYRVPNLLVQRARDEIVALRQALDESVKLQSHYAALLNDYDGGKRMQFKDWDDWLRRLRVLKDKRGD